jgi:endonuclease/exonuclease/phosphatase family metal-dependent hydrolase
VIPEAAARVIDVATYNVHRCVGRDGREDVERVAAVVCELGAKLVALQEVQGGHDGRSDQLAALAQATGLEPIPGPTLRDDRGTYGNALFTALPHSRVRRVDLSVEGVEPRGALDVLLDTPPGPLRVIATHLGLSRAERRRQGVRLSELLTEGESCPTVLLGDFNEWAPRGVVARRLARALRAASARATFPAWRPVLALDRLWASRGIEVLQVAAHRSPLARVASDHLPLRASLRLVSGVPGLSDPG